MQKGLEITVERLFPGAVVIGVRSSASLSHRGLALPPRGDEDAAVKLGTKAGSTCFDAWLALDSHTTAHSILDSRDASGKGQAAACMRQRVCLMNRLLN